MNASTSNSTMTHPPGSYEMVPLGTAAPSSPLFSSAQEHLDDVPESPHPTFFQRRKTAILWFTLSLTAVCATSFLLLHGTIHPSQKQSILAALLPDPTKLPPTILLHHPNLSLSEYFQDVARGTTEGRIHYLYTPTNEPTQLEWRSMPPTFADHVQKRMVTASSNSTIQVLNHDNGVQIQQMRNCYITWPEQTAGYSFEIMGPLHLPCTDMQDFIQALEYVTEEEWLGTVRQVTKLVDGYVPWYDSPQVIYDMIQDVPVPPKFDYRRLHLHMRTVSDRVLRTWIAIGMVCVWVDEWSHAILDQEQNRVQKAIEVLEKVNEWKIIAEMEESKRGIYVEFGEMVKDVGRREEVVDRGVEYLSCETYQ